MRQRFDVELIRDVGIALFTRQSSSVLYVPGRECPSCESAQRLLEETSELSSRVKLDIVDYYAEQERAKSTGVSKIPATLIGSSGSTNIRMYGLPAGRAFGVLLDGIVLASSGRRQLGLETRKSLKRLKEDVHIQVFVTPNCPHCPSIAHLAHQMGKESPCVVADVVDVRSFPRIGEPYGVKAVPKTVINDSVMITGAVGEEALLRGGAQSRRRWWRRISG
ncbi:MAG: thioredoxin family protein [Chloroflexi bacterium]|nr:thioredoxin family protein [Chloroflexota bacterium]